MNNTGLNFQLVVIRDSYSVLHCQVKRCKSTQIALKLCKNKDKTPGNNIYTLLTTFIAFSSFISSKFHFPYKLSYYAWATCGLTDKDHPQATSCKPIYHGKPVICSFCSHSAKPAW